MADYWRCPECGAVCFEDDATQHEQWHLDQNDLFRRAFDGIADLDWRVR